MRQRARSAAVFVPLLLLALAIGRPAVVAVVALGVLLGALETYRLLAAAGYPALPALGPVVALALVADAALPATLGAGGPLLVGIALVVLAVAAFARPDPRGGPAAPWGGVSGACKRVGAPGSAVRQGRGCGAGGNAAAAHERPPHRRPYVGADGFHAQCRGWECAH